MFAEEESSRGGGSRGGSRGHISNKKKLSSVAKDDICLCVNCFENKISFGKCSAQYCNTREKEIHCYK